MGVQIVNSDSIHLFRDSRRLSRNAGTGFHLAVTDHHDLRSAPAQVSIETVRRGDMNVDPATPNTQPAETQEPLWFLKS
jgi:hypothetical protein